MLELVAVGIGGFILGRITAGMSDRSNPDHVEQYLNEHRAELQDRYETTRMDYVEFEDRITILELPGTERIMRDAIQVDGIGVETSFELARTFQGDYDAYRNAERDELERVNGIGENRATALLNH